jgi:NhaP-type Na+/H+ or K+/H+ antiporter
MNVTTLALIAGFILLFGLVSGRIRRTVVTAPMFFVVFGFVLGGEGVQILALGIENDTIEAIAELTLVLVLFADAARIDLRLLRKEQDIPVRLLTIGLTLTVVAGTAAGLALFPGLTFWEAAIVAVILTPTDAALAQVVISSRGLPARVRQALNVESGLNDGLAVPLLVLFLSLAGVAGGHHQGNLIWFTVGQLTLGPAIGIGIGFVGSKLLSWSNRRGWIDEAFLRLSALGLAILAYAGAELAGGNGFIAAFAAGLTMGNVARDVCSTLYNFAEAEGQLLILLTFVIFGSIILPGGLVGLTWAVVVYAALSLTAVRLLPVAISLVGKKLMWESVGLIGWFGPRGIASIIYLLVVVNGSELAGESLIVTITAFTVAASVLLHGFTAAPLTGLYQRAYAAMPPDAEMAEAQPVHELPTRDGMQD